MKRRHDMPFGASVLDDGGVRFRLWAPSAKRVGLKLNTGGPGCVLPMQAKGEGWFELTTDAARPGSRYMYVVDENMQVPDPASRDQAGDVHGWSTVVDPTAFDWKDDGWRGRPWDETILYELHVGTFSRSGSYAGVAEHFDHLVGLGITAIELMPLAEAPGRHNWGYDGVYLFAPDGTYGRPNDLKLLVEAAHRRGLMVFLDVVYNHFGPEGNYLGAYAKPFFSERHHTPWGAAINYDGEHSRVVRDFMIHNALYWLKEYNIDGLRLDAVHAIIDESRPNVLVEMADTVRRHFPDRHVHLVLENDNNAATLLQPASRRRDLYDAQWNDDVHHALHVAITGVRDGYYADYAERPVRWLGRALAEGFGYQGEPSEHRGGKRRGEPSGQLLPTAFVSFLQNHDQVGNTAFGARITQIASPEAVRAAAAIYLLAPSPPLLFMGEEWAASTPFAFFCDFGPELAAKVREGRRLEFARFKEFQDPDARDRIPDPTAVATFLSARLNWAELEQSPHKVMLAYYRRLLDLRRREIVPRLKDIAGGAATYDVRNGGTLRVRWQMVDGDGLELVAQLIDEAGPPVTDLSQGRLVFATHPDIRGASTTAWLPPWSVAWFKTGKGVRQ